MSETLRDQALKGALSLLDSKKKIAFVNYRYGTNNTDKQTYVAKITPEQIEIILRRQAEIVTLNNLKSSQTTQQTIDSLLSANGKISLGAEAEQVKALDAIYGIILNASGFPSVVEIINIFSYSQLSGLTTPLENLKYLVSIIDTKDMVEAVNTEHTIVNAITNKLQESFSSQYAQQLLGEQGYKDIVGMLDKPKDVV